jgi:hypothetical protein
VYENTGAGFTEDTNSNLPGYVMYSSSAFGDYDNDGDLDILTPGYIAGNDPTASFIIQLTLLSNLSVL